MNWKKEYRKISELKSYEANPRKISEKGLQDLKNSIRKFGIESQPLVINTDNTIIGGHARLLACQSLGYDKVPVMVPSKKLTDKEFQELNIRLNKNIAGEFDFDILANLFEIDDLLDWGFDESEFGVSLDEEFGEDFTLPDGDKEPFQQMTFTLADEQAEFIKAKLGDIKKSEEFKYVETFGNQNSNGNALYLALNG